MMGLADLMDAAIAVKLAELHTCFPASIETYDHTQQRASVKPLLNRRLKDGRIEELPVIANVPVWFPRAGGASITMPVKRGDTVLVACAERSLDEWLERGGVQTPADRRKHALFDGVAFPGLLPFATGSLAENNDDLLITFAGSRVRLKPGGNVEVEAAARVKIETPTVLVECVSATVNATSVTINADTENNGDVQINGHLTVSGLTTSGGYTSTGTWGDGRSVFNGTIEVTEDVIAHQDVTADGISLNSHTHQDSLGGSTGGPQ